VKRIESGERAGDLLAPSMPALRLAVNPAVAESLGRALPAGLGESAIAP
jgi:hypothetical protein